MTSTTKHLDRKDIPTPLARGIGSYNGKKFKVTFSDTFTPHSMQWSGGTRSTYVAMNLDTGEQVPLTDTRPFPENQGPIGSTPAVPHIVYVQHSIFCGKDTGITFHCHPSLAAKLLPESDAQLSDAQACLLNLFAGYKSSYRREAWRSAGYSVADWDRTVAELIETGHLKKHGKSAMITTKGRNARTR